MEKIFREIDLLFYFTIFLSEHQEHFGGNDEPETTLSEINFTEKFQSAIIKDKVQKEIFILEKDDVKFAKRKPKCFHHMKIRLQTKCVIKSLTQSLMHISKVIRNQK